jgi:hypothetical protein
MPFVISPGTVRVLVHLSIHGRQQLNVLHGNFPGQGPLPNDLAETIFTAAKANLASSLAMAQFASTFSFTGISTRDLRFENQPDLPSTSTGVPGTATGNALPEQVSIVVTLRTALAGRSFRGRVYTFGYTEAAVMADGTIADDAATAAQNFVTNIASAMGGAGVPLAIHSPALPERPGHGGILLPAKPFAITPVTSIEVRDRIFDTNRRRLDTLRR